jgi:hypothetical protein
MLRKILKLWEIRYLIILSIVILKLEISGCDTFRGVGAGERHERNASSYVPPMALEHLQCKMDNLSL